MNSHHTTRTTVIGPRQHFLIATLMLGTLLSASHAFAQKMRFFPIRTAPLGSPPGTIGNPVTPEFNSGLGCWEVQVLAGTEVHIDVQPSGWGDAPGTPTLGALQATVDPAGYSNGLGGDLVPKGWPATPQDGIFYTRAACTGNGDWCNPPFDNTCGGGANGTCEHNPDWVMPPCTLDLPCNVTATLEYVWASVVQNDCNVDDGEIKTLGGWILNVPLDAAATYVIAFDPDPNNSFMSSILGLPIPGLEFASACITILDNNDPGRCCSDIGSDAECDDGDTCTTDACDQCGGCVHIRTCPDIRFYPHRLAPLGSPSGTVGNAVTPAFNSELGCWEVKVPPGIEVDIDLQGFGWGNAPGSPTLLVIQATVISAGYDNGVGAPLNPKGWPDSTEDGLYQAMLSCQAGGDGRPCSFPFDQTCADGENGICMPNPNWVMPPCASGLTGILSATLDYAWGAVALNDCNIDDGSVRTMGGLILDVPQDALGTYVIDINPDPMATFMTSGQETSIPGLTLTPACITIEIPDFNRYVSFEKGSPDIVAYRLDMVSSLFHPDAIVSGWVGVPDDNDIASLEPDPVERAWDEETVYIAGCEITPVATFELYPMLSGGTFLPPITLQTTAQPGASKFWGDIVGSFNGIFWSAAQGVVNIDDVLSIIKTWQQADSAPSLQRADVVPQELNRVVNFNDVLFVNFAFQGKYYPFGCPGDPCRDNIANPCP